MEAAVARQLAAAQQQWQQQLAEAAEVAVQRWSSQALPPLLAPMQEAVAATAELAASVATEAAGLSGDLRQLAERCGQQEEALSGLQQRVCDAEGCGQPGAAAALLDEQLRQRQQADLEEVQRDVEALSLAACELPGLQQQLAAVAEQQAQHAATTDGVVQSGAPDSRLHSHACHASAAPAHPLHARTPCSSSSSCLGLWTAPRNRLPCLHLLNPCAVMTDVKALARHTKALDKEMRSLRKEARATQEALLRSCSAFSRALSMQSPLGGPFTAFPVEKE